MILSFLLALSLSLDALGAGMACGLRRISLPIFSRIVLGLETAGLLFLFLKAGTFLAACLPPHWAERGAALFLVGFGLFLLFQGCRKQTDSPSPLKFLRSPSQCDTDGSAVLEAGEALLLGLVLSADACGVGLSAAAAGFSVYWLPFFRCSFTDIFPFRGRRRRKTAYGSGTHGGKPLYPFVRRHFPCHGAFAAVLVVRHLFFSFWKKYAMMEKSVRTANRRR